VAVSKSPGRWKKISRGQGREAASLGPKASLLYTEFIQTHSLSQALAGIVLPDADGRELRLGSLWESRPAVLVFLRHYG